MSSSRPLARLARLLALVLSLAALVTPVAAAQDVATPPASAVTVAAAGLVNPRGFTWGPTGDLIVAEAGTGGDTPASGEVEVPAPVGPYTGGATAAVVTAGGACPVSLASGLPSARSAAGETLGVADVAYLGDALYALVSGGGAAHGNPDRPNGVYRIAAGGELEMVADLGAWLTANPVANPPAADYDPEGSFYAMVPDAAGDALLVAESNSGQVLRVTTDGAVTRVADLSAEHRVPTALAVAPDGGVYAGELTAAPYPAGGASVLRIAADGSVTTAWTGLTAVTGLAVAPDGTLFAAQLAETRDRPPVFQLTSGSIVRQTGEASAVPVLQGLNLPTALRFGPDGALYVSGPAIGADAGSGLILRVDPAAEGATADLAALSVPSCRADQPSGETGDGTGGAGAADSLPKPTPPSDGTGGAEAGGTGSSAGQAGGAADSEIVVRIFDNGFDPEVMTVAVGATVIWANTGQSTHTTVSVTDGQTVWDSGELPPGGIFTFTFTAPGTYQYTCAIHPEMTGTIVVQG